MDLTPPTLTGRFVRLEPVAEPHREGLRAAANDPRIWEFNSVSGYGPAFDAWFANALAPVQRIPFTVRRLADDAIVGSTGYLDPVPPHKRVEIGHTWYRPDCWGTAVNPECKLLLMTHAFEVMRANRVSYVTDMRNLRSQAAIAKLGAVREGVLRSHMVVQGGRIRDSVLFSVIASEWPAVKDRLQARLAG
jgi:N-acetyltransferase